jgi:hypothetical protein
MLKRFYRHEILSIRSLYSCIIGFIRLNIGNNKSLIFKFEFYENTSQRRKSGITFTNNFPLKHKPARFTSSFAELRFMGAIRSEIVPDDHRQLSTIFQSWVTRLALIRAATRSCSPELFACHGLFTPFFPPAADRRRPGIPPPAQ